MDRFSVEEYWIQAARNSALDPDQIASQNYQLPLPVHRSVRVRQIGFLEGVLNQLPRPLKVLDLGCGPGTWGLQLADQVDRWLGYDIAPDFIEHARLAAQRAGHAHLEFRVGSLLDVSPQEKFELVVLGGTLGYLKDEELLPLMQRIGPHLSPGGKVYVRVSIIPGPYPRITLRRGYPIQYRKTSHYLRIFEQAGFGVDVQRDLAFTEASLATAYTALARCYGRTGMTAYRWAERFRWLAFGLVRQLVDLTPLPQSMQFVLTPRR